MLAVQSIHSFSTLVAKEPAANEASELESKPSLPVRDDVPTAPEPTSEATATKMAPTPEGVSEAEYYPHLQSANDHRFGVTLQMPATILQMRPAPVSVSDQSLTTDISEAQFQGSYSSQNALAETPTPIAFVVPPMAAYRTQSAPMPDSAASGSQPGSVVVTPIDAIPSVASLVAKEAHGTVEAMTPITVLDALIPDRPTVPAAAECLQQTTSTIAETLSPAIDNDVVAPIAKPRKYQVLARHAVEFMRPAFRYMRPGVLYLLVVPTVVGVNLGYETVRDTWRDYATAKANVASLQKQVADLQRPAPVVPLQPTQTLPPPVINGPGAMQPYVQYAAPAAVSMPMPLPDEPPARAPSTPSVARAKQSHTGATAPAAAKSDIPEDGEFVLEKPATKQTPASDFKLVGDK